MKQLGLLTIGGIVMISVFLSTGATTTPEDDQECGLEFTSIDFYTITVLWRKACFDGDRSYTLEVDGTRYCLKSDIDCPEEEELCQIATIDMGCEQVPIAPCLPVSFNVTGNTLHKTLSGHTIAAPTISDWKLEASVNNSNLNVTWGPLTGNDVSCATDALITATCVSSGSGTTVINKTINRLDPELAHTEELSLLEDCIGGPVTSVTITYLSVDDAPTERKMTYDGGDLTYETASTTALPVDSTTNTAKTESSDSTTAGVTGDGLSGGVIAGIVIGSLLGTYITNRIQI